MKRILNILTLLCILGLTTTSFVHSAPASHESSPIVQGILMQIDGPFYIIKDSTGKEQRVHVDKNTIIIGKILPGAKVKAEVTQDGHAFAVAIVGS